MNEEIYKLSRQADTLARNIVPDLREIVLYDRVRDEQLVMLVAKDYENKIKELNKRIETLEAELLLAKQQ